MPANQGVFGRTMKQAGRRDQIRKDRDFEERLKQQQDAVQGKVSNKEAGPRARDEEHLADLQGHKRNM